MRISLTNWIFCFIAASAILGLCITLHTDAELRRDILCQRVILIRDKDADFDVIWIGPDGKERKQTNVVDGHKVEINFKDQTVIESETFPIIIK